MPKKDIKFVRNPVWKASTDSLRKAYVNAINVDETGNQTTIYQEMGTNSPNLGMSFDALVPPADDQSLLNQLKNAASQQSSMSTLYSGFVSNIQDTDMATAATQLSLNQTALQAALQVTASLNKLSLLNYLPVSGG